MREKFCKIVVTGGAGFIGSEFVRQIAALRYQPVVIDKLTYAGDLDRLESVKGSFKFYKADICDKAKMESIFKAEKAKYVVHFAAESHVDRSIADASPFIDTNIKGTQVLLDVCRRSGIEKLVHISTDEVYGEIKKGRFYEGSPIRSNSPYAASKAAADLLVQAYMRTYKFPACIVRPCNNYGPWQYPEKLIPVITLNAFKNRKVPVYGRGENVREWLYVVDCAAAILLILKKGRRGEVYNVGSGQERRNIDTVKMILNVLGKPRQLINFVQDRAGHDFRYSLSNQKIKRELGWSSKVVFNEGLKMTVAWYLSSRYLTRSVV